MTVFVTILVALVLQIILISKAPISLRVRLITTASILFALVLNADLQRDKRQSVILHNAAKRFFFFYGAALSVETIPVPLFRFGNVNFCLLVDRRIKGD